MLNLNPIEEDILAYWKEKGIPEKVREKNRNGEHFYFLDGPPYVTGELHPGQIWVKSVKDIFIRYRRLNGYNVHDRAGYDVHGLPIEHKVEESLKLGSKQDIEKKVGVENFISYCREYVDSLIPKMERDYIRFGVSLDFANAYKPYNDIYIEKAWGIFKRASENGYLYSGLRPMLYCPKCETVLAQGSLEVEYSDEKDPSIFVAFRVDAERSRTHLKLDAEAYLVVWTTTPWTLPANMAVAANPKELYVRARIRGKSMILAKSRLDEFVAILNESAIVEEEFYGSEMEGLHYVHPLEKEVPMQESFRIHHKIILTKKLVSADEGSGLVHIAPGHGFEDYAVGRENSLPVFCPVDQHASYTMEAGRYAGMKIPEEANRRILEDLKANGSLLDSGIVKHSYPHCWRCNTKLIYRATKQWFFSVEKMRSKLISENGKVVWHPEEAAAWQRDVLEGSPDWCVSRQRYWATPLPIWICEKCGAYEVIGSRAELRERCSDRELLDSLRELHKPYIDGVTLGCACGGIMKRVSDVSDVWFDSGIAFEASLSDDEFSCLFPAAFVLEGKDQLRGWFSYMLKSSVMVHGRSPFRHVVIDGMLIAEDGREMHKHLGNYISIAELLKLTSADAFRLWCSGHTQWLDLQFKREEIAEAEKALSILYNIFNLFSEYTSAIGYIPEDTSPPHLAGSNAEDIWILSRLNSLIKGITGALEGYDVNRANALLGRFLLEDLSRTYLKLAKKRILYSERDTARAAVKTVNHVMYTLLLLLAPFIPFSAEHLYLETYGKYMEEESIFMKEWPKATEKSIDKELEKGFGLALESVAAILGSRERSGIRLRWPLQKATLEVNSENIQLLLRHFSGIIADYTNVKEIDVRLVGAFRNEVRPLFAKLGPEFKERSGSVAEALRKADAEELLSAVGSSGYYLLHTESGPVQVNAEHFTVIERLEKENAVPFKGGLAYVDTNIDKELREEALIREFGRRVQLLRKELRLRKPDRIRLNYVASQGLRGMIERNKKQIMKNLNAALLESGEGRGTLKEFEIGDEPVRIWAESVPGNKVQGSTG